MVTPHLPWKFHANRSSRFLAMLLTKKQRKKERNCPKTIPRPPTGGGVQIQRDRQINIRTDIREWLPCHPACVSCCSFQQVAVTVLKSGCGCVLLGQTFDLETFPKSAVETQQKHEPLGPQDNGTQLWHSVTGTNTKPSNLPSSSANAWSTYSVIFFQFSVFWHCWLHYRRACNL